jgi:hypothetical protein
LETKLKIIADFEAGKQAVIRNVEPDLQCYKDVLTEMKKPRIQPTIKPFFQEDGQLYFFIFLISCILLVRRFLSNVCH